MRSEKEGMQKVDAIIKARLHRAPAFEEVPFDVPLSIADNYKKNIDAFGSGFVNGIAFMLEGEPRYSVEELKKIWGSLEDGEKTSFREFKKYFPDDVWSWINNLILFIENNPEKVKEILERD